MKSGFLRVMVGVSGVAIFGALSSIAGCIIDGPIGGGEGGADSGTAANAGGGGPGSSGSGDGGSPGSGGSGAGGGSGGPCGGLNGPACEAGFYCVFTTSCANPDAPGVCQPIPDACDLDCPGVCGCDGQSYCNACIAAQAGQDVIPDEWCAPPGDACGGFSPIPCPGGQYCDFPDAHQCGVLDGGGACKDIPDACPQDCPGVCGCDSQFYCNACIAAQAGVDVDPNASCSPP
jgi:hypothetical protein